MRAAFAIAAALLLAACRVDVEGAHCTLPGSASECPDGQACGNDLKCSARAAACTARCDLDARRCVPGNAVETCVASADPICGSWQRSDDCQAKELLCSTTTSQGAACDCPANATAEFAADPENTQPAPHPSGAATPKACRFSRLGDALAAAAAHPGAATVRAYGTAGTSVVFGASSGDTLPLVVASNVTLVGAAGVLDTTIRGDGPSAATIVAVSGTVEGIRVTNVSQAGAGVELTCVSAEPALRDVTVSSGTPKLKAGIAIAGPCGATLQRVDASGASGAALDVTAASPANLVTVTGSRFHGSGTGIHASGAKLVVGPDGATASEVTGNAGTGILVDGTNAVDVTLTGVVVAANGGTGVVVRDVPATSTFRMSGCDVHSNAGAAATQYGVVPRNAGGLLFSTQAFTLDVNSNRFHANDGGALGADEIAFEKGTGWTINPGPCTNGVANAIGCIGTGFSVSIVGGGNVDAGNTTWPGAAPMTNGFVNTQPACAPWSATCP